MSVEETCAVCGRTILAGERVRAYVSAEGRRAVCELCGPRAERRGWRSEGDDPEAEPVAAGPGKATARGLRHLLSRRGARNRPPASPSPAAPAAPAPDPDPAAAGMRTAPPEDPTLGATRFERAASRFNASEAGHTVAGLMRTLGPPWVSVGASAGAANEVRVTVAWELSWYQWGIDLGDDGRPVFQLDKGLEISQLDAAARQWNASVAEGGRVVLVPPGKHPGAPDPVRR
jgi:hypothetical protein